MIITSININRANHFFQVIYEERATVRNRFIKDEDICMKNSSASSEASAAPHSLSIADQILNVSMPLLMLLIYCYWKS